MSASNTTRTYAWDFETRLASVSRPDGAKVAFLYDPFGRRIQKTTPSGVTIYAYDGSNVQEELDNAGNVKKRFTYGPGIDEPLVLQYQSDTFFYEADALGSVTSLTDATGTVAATYTYDSFGNLTNSTGSAPNRFRYTGREWDGDTGLYYYRARYYDPSIGRFISEDPIGFVGSGTNFYAYVRNNPINLTDSMGLCPKDKQQCLANFYNSLMGKAVQFGSPLSLLPGWNSSWKQNLGEWAVAIAGKGGGLLGSGAVTGTTTITTLSGTVTVGSAIELFTETALGLIEKGAWPAMALATAADLAAHAYCAQY